MPTLLRSRSWAGSKPGNGATLDVGHPLAQGLVTCLPHTEGNGWPRDLVSGQYTTSSNGGAATWQVDTGGLGMHVDTTPLAFPVTTAAPFPFQSSDPITYAALVTISGGAGTYRDIFRCDNNGISSPRTIFCLRLNSSDQIECLFGTISVSFVGFASTTTYLPGPKPILFAFARNPGGTIDVYADGALVASNADVGASVTYESPLQPFCYTGFKTSLGDSEQFVGTKYLDLVYRRYLSQSEMQWLTAEPYAMLRHRRPVGFPAAAYPTLPKITYPQPPGRRAPSALHSFQRQWIASAPANATFNQNLTATVPTSSSIVNQVGARKPTTVTTAATQAHAVTHALSSPVTTTSVLRRSVAAIKGLGVTTTTTSQRGVQRNVATSVTTSATLSFLKSKLLALSATVSTTPTIAKSVAKAISTVASTAPTYQRVIGKTVSAGVTTSSTVTAIKVKLVSLLATVSTTATSLKGVSKAISTVASTSPTYQRLVGKTTSGSVATSPVLGKGIAKAVAAAVTTTATFLKAKLVLLQAAVTTTASVQKSVGHQISTALGSAVVVTRAVGKTVTASLVTLPVVRKRVGKTIKSTVVTVPLLGAVKTSGTSFSGSVVAWIPYIPDETALGQPVTLQVVFAAADGSRPVLDAPPIARVFQDNGGTETVLAGPTAMTSVGTGWTLAYTPSTVGPQALEVRGLLSGATQFYCVGFTVRPQFDPIALAVNDVLASRM